MTTPEPEIITEIDGEPDVEELESPWSLEPMSPEEYAIQFEGIRLPGLTPRPQVPNVGGLRQKVIEQAMTYLGQPYSWGNLDCSGLVQKAFAHVGVELPRVSFQQAAWGRTIGQSEAQPGDLVAWDNSSRNDGADHIAIYLGGGQILEAPRTGLNVRIRDLDPDEDVWFVSMAAGVD
jgi:cell wall-associated NlpC family hydrolase